MKFSFHSQQFTYYSEETGIVCKQNIQPIFTIIPTVARQRFLHREGDCYTFEYVKGVSLNYLFERGTPSVVLSLLFNLLKHTIVFHDGRWYSWLDDYSPSNFVISEKGELVVIDWLEAQWFEVTPEWCICQMKKLCMICDKIDNSCEIIEQQLWFFIERQFPDLLGYFDVKLVESHQRIPMRTVWMYDVLKDFRRPAFVECQQYRILNNLENDLSIDLGPFDSVENQDPIWYNLIRKHLI